MATMTNAQALALAIEMLTKIEKGGSYSTREWFDNMLRIRDAAAADVVVHGGYTRRQLEAAFAKVANKDNWKNPIDALIDRADYEICDQAVCFYCGCHLTRAPRLATGHPNLIRVTAPGYYVAVGA